MAQKKYLQKRDPVFGICINLVRSHVDRQEGIETMRREQEALRTQIKGFNMSGMPSSSRSGISDPVSATVEKIEAIEEVIKAEQHRVNVVAAAIENLGSFEKDLEIGEKIRQCILDNILQGGFIMPFEHITGYPYGRKTFYTQRKHFLREIAKELHLMR